MNLHVCLLSGDLMANVIGALHDRADRVVTIATPSACRLVGFLRDALVAAGARVTVEDPIEVSPVDLEECLATLRRVADQFPGAAYNWTGGTKVMSFAARRVAEERRARALFVRTASREILIENLATGTSRVDVTDAVRLGLNLLAHFRAAGHTVDAAQTPADFAHQYTPSPDLVIAANAILDASPSERGDLFQLAGTDRLAITPRRLNSGFLYILKRASLIEPGPDPGSYQLALSTSLPKFHLESPQEANARFLRASFLEVFLWSQIRERCGITDVGWAIRLNPGEQGRMAEIDIAVSGDGRLLIIEAKTNVELSRLADLIEEQAARCRRLGGPFARWMLYVHKFRAEHAAIDAAAIIAAQEARAEDYGGRLIWHDDLNDLPRIVGALLEDRESSA
ncbi:MAG: DUF1887 family protein [Verrucomicrobiales bacterium]|nr:DUF1887 family protein [Verrucomicrobiales bacterium]